MQRTFLADNHRSTREMRYIGHDRRNECLTGPRERPKMEQLRGLADIDLNLLPKFRALYHCRSISKAAQELRLGESAVREALARMRSFFGDDLLIDSSTGFTPTERGRRLVEIVNEALAELTPAIIDSAAFDARASARTFHVAASPLVEACVLPELVSAMRSAAPNVRLNVSRLDPQTLRDELRTGWLDLAVGYLPKLGRGFCDDELLTSALVCVSRPDHPIVTDTAAYTAAEYPFVVIGDEGDLSSAVNRALQGFAGFRFVRTTNALVLPLVLTRGDLIAVVPQWYARRYLTPLGLQMTPAPVDQCLASIRIVSSKGKLHDQGRVWLQDLITQSSSRAIELTANAVRVPA